MVQLNPMHLIVHPPTPPLPRNRYRISRLALSHNMSKTCGFSTVKISHFDVMSVNFLFYSFVLLRDYSYSKLEVPWHLKNVPPNATAL